MNHSDAVERYLRTVTLLLPPAAAREVRAELTAHLHYASLDAQLGGLSAAEAQAKALREAGSPVLAALRFARIYTLGYVLRGALITAALGGAAFAVQSGTHSHEGSKRLNVEASERQNPLPLPADIQEGSKP